MGDTAENDAATRQALADVHRHFCVPSAHDDACLALRAALPNIAPPDHIDTTPMGTCPSDGRPCPYSCTGESVCSVPPAEKGGA